MEITLEQFCNEYLGGMYQRGISEENQSTGYKLLKKMVLENIEPASLKEIDRWVNNPTPIELITPPELKYLRFLHPLLRPIIIKNWDIIKKLPIENKA